jgi:hypothetical protein
VGQVLYSLHGYDDDEDHEHEELYGHAHVHGAAARLLANLVRPPGLGREGARGVVHMVCGGVVCSDNILLVIKSSQSVLCFNSTNTISTSMNISSSYIETNTNLQGRLAV